MDKELTLFSINSFLNTSSENVEVFCESLYKIILDSVMSDSTESLEETLKNLTSRFERISNFLGIEETHNRNCYLFGQIVSITNLVIDINKKHLQSQALESIANSYTLLLPALRIIKQYNTISGVDLQKEMGMKSSSNLSNFLKRIDKFDLVNIHKVGTKNYISLTNKGEKLLEKKEKSTQVQDKEQLTIDFIEVLKLLDVIARNLSDLESTSIEIVHECCAEKTEIQVKRLLKQKIDEILSAREAFYKNKVRSYSNNKVFNTYDRKVHRKRLITNSVDIYQVREV